MILVVFRKNCLSSNTQHLVRLNGQHTLRGSCVSRTVVNLWVWT